MFAVIYRFRLKPEQVDAYKTNWNIIVDYFKKYRGAIGSCLHKGDDDLWVAYSRWPDRKTRDAAWPGDDQPSANLPPHIRAAIQSMQRIKQDNNDLEQFDEICLEVIEDRL